MVACPGEEAKGSGLVLLNHLGLGDTSRLSVGHQDKGSLEEDRGPLPKGPKLWDSQCPVGYSQSHTITGCSEPGSAGALGSEVKETKAGARGEGRGGTDTKGIGPGVQEASRVSVHPFISIQQYFLSSYGTMVPQAQSGAEKRAGY